MDSVEKNAKAIFPYEEALAKTKEYFNGDELAASVWINKYAMKDSFGNLYECTPEDMHRRLAKEFARIEKKYPNPMSEEEIFQLLDHFKYIIPQGGPMSGIGNGHQIASLSNCFVIGHEKPADSYGGILKIDEEQVQLMKRRGGVGHDLSHIRPGGSPVLNSALTSTGVVPFMERYSNSTREVAQDGRRGALMLTISVKHPDAENFIDAKLEQNKVTGANVSVKINDEFMKAALAEKPYMQQYPVDATNPKYKKEMDAASLWKKIIHNAWKSAEPGVLFWDTIIRESVADCYADLGYRTVSTNPCGEIPLCPYDSCRLIAINLYSYVEKPFTSQAKFNISLFKDHVIKAMRLNDDLVDLEMEKIDAIISKIDRDPEDEVIKRTERELWTKIKEKTLGGRRTGLGITAEGDMLAALGLRYGSEEAIQVGVQVQKTLALAAYRSSVIMGQERGPFPIYDSNRELRNPMIERIRQEDEELYQLMVSSGRRNISMLTIAPTGTTSLMTQTTSGIEQVFLPVYQRRKKVNPNDKNANISYTDKMGDAFEEYNVFHHKFLDWAEVNGHNKNKVMAMNKEELQALVQESPYYKATANDVDWVAKVKMQGQMQKWVDHSISVTVNLPSDITEDMVAKVYRTAWEWGCKGITVYREGSRSGVLVPADSPEKGGKMMKSMPKERPEALDAEVIRFKNANEQWIAFVGLYEGRPYEIFTGKLDEDTRVIPKSVTMGQVLKVVEEKGSRYDFRFIDKYGYPNTVGGISHMFNQAYWNYAKLISGVLRNGLPVEEVVHLVSSLELDSQTINNWRTGVERALKRYIPNGTKDTSGIECEKCGAKNLIYQEGCLLCMSCGNSKCG
ncbi:MAG: adenosylcobalamin-dependent ribonucleoside-diphosphate reductase [Bacteroidales bacterium]|jgi:ribonucleoside-diphosphate reductase alpha chain|nr:adenosylcobalamin-dependent ribonucleoside-diphosphate reductase [Bacteroidales bacterium]MDD2263371.1 adenosylcobalamin-dependent ribonucleoside-diphosphate reductase [Bacteroidales bacterium]MDD2830839.1 adenosylcobalamin-dependent ribonucleoside-diphosphate reductase [Bacteroidales bacterium]MDD3208038.1 adenosylcobalamin-dependent ribonucleoside-diphosphate reductase [Bacteroidales bacterium]MDD3696455.1 adenosylcobalamin-dependent ribonucleoside-diphosphate reductase [Bacteroidales bact